MTGLVPKVYVALEEAVEIGIAHGARRVVETGLQADAHAAKEIFAEEVINSICERFHLVEPEPDAGAAESW